MVLKNRRFSSKLGQVRDDFDKKRHVNWSGLSNSEVRRIFQFCMFLETRDISGEIAECGVGKGITLVFWSNLIKQYSLNRALYAFDSFEGFPLTTENDFGGGGRVIKPKYKKFSLEYVKEVCIKLGLSPQEVASINFKPGWIPESLTDCKDVKFSLVNLDVDLYEPTRDALIFFWERLSLGGIIILDEYDFGLDEIKWPGARKAVDEFCLTHSLLLSRHFTGRVYLKKA